MTWIEQGATREIENEPQLVRVALDESEFSLLPDQKQNLRMVAHYSDASFRDVTKLATYLSNESAVVAVSDHGQLLAGSLPG